MFIFLCGLTDGLPQISTEVLILKVWFVLARSGRWDKKEKKA
jgi:hypothetical protein